MSKYINKYTIAAVLLLLLSPVFAFGGKGTCRDESTNCPEVRNAPSESRAIKMTIVGGNCTMSRPRYSRSTGGNKSWRRQKEECEQRERRAMGRTQMRKSAILQREKPRLRSSRANLQRTTRRRVTSGRYSYSPAIRSTYRRTYRR